MEVLKLLGKKKKKKSKETAQKKAKSDKSSQKKTKKLPIKYKKRKDDEISLTALRAVIKKLDSNISPKRMPFFLAYINNGCKGGPAYLSTHPHVTKNSAEVMAHNWLKDIKLTDLLTLCGLGYGKIIDDLKRLDSKERLHFLTKFFKLDTLQVDIRHKMEVTVLPPPKPVLPPPIKVVDVVKKRTVKSPAKPGTTVEKSKIKDAAKKVKKGE